MFLCCDGAMGPLSLRRGVDRTALLFQFRPGPAIAAANADKGGPGPAAINKYVAPRALLWFRWGAVVTWLSGAALLESAPHLSLVDAFTLQGASQVIGVGAWLGTIMLFNVWVLICRTRRRSSHRLRVRRGEEPGPAGSRCWHHEPTRCCRSRCCCSWGRLRTVCPIDRLCRGGEIRKGTRASGTSRLIA